ncbi:hypothetical protein [Methylobacterium iners]|uniref:Uncharacterized protein n=1 Tax=Methylobacterium iners TaxID=418707 RepID=A0ABQ4S4P6_9HYPH|nr:hypothetical protein [Methylobacterium iners]GJD97459.1 hypothetical protein OCOJLMKI_4690 [Methylobacterium iners]
MFALLLGPAGRYLAGAAIILAVLAGAFAAGVAYERPKVEAAEARTAAAKAAAAALADAAQANADAAKRLGEDLRRQAESFAKDAEIARFDGDRVALAREAAALAAQSCADPPEPLVDDPVHRALKGERVSEDADLPGSLKAAMDALRKPKGKAR